MVRRNGENIACAEVEAVLRLLRDVVNVAVVGVPDATVGEELKAYVQVRAESSKDPDRILAHCAENLASFKVPRYVQFVDALPLSESSRVEKKKLVEGIDDLTLDSFDRVLRRWATVHEPSRRS